MKLVSFFLFIFFLQQETLVAQFTDNFSDQNFSDNPKWLGNDTSFTVENEVLRLTANENTNTGYLSTISQAVLEASWEFDIEYTFQPSGNNHARIYLIADNQDLTADLNGYYLEVGATNRSVRLLRQDGTDSSPIISGIENRLASNPVQLSVRVTRDIVGFWEVFTDTTGGNNYQNEGSGFDDTYLIGDYFGVYCTFTPTRADRFYFDNFNVTGTPFLDETPPSIVTVEAVSANELTVLCDKGVDLTSFDDLTNFEVTPNVGIPSSAERNPSKTSEFTLTFDTSFEIGKPYTLSTENISNFSGYTSSKQEINFQYIVAQEAEYGDILINEFMVNSSPTVGLPDHQYVELYNRSDKYFHLKDWKLSDANSDGTIQDVWLYPDSFVVLVPTAGLSDYPSATNVTSWATLNLTEDRIQLSSTNGELINAVHYTKDWYGDELKSEGGYSIERINPTFNCSNATNWRASSAETGGTPGITNSEVDTLPDAILPSISFARALNEKTILLSFNKGINPELTPFNATSITPTITIDSIHFESVFPETVSLHLAGNLQKNIPYTILLNQVVDCNANENSIETTVYLPDSATIGDVVINEILHHPLTGGADFIELYNTSSKYIDLHNWSFANYDEGLANEKWITQHYILAPQHYVTITSDSSFLKVNYPFSGSGNYIHLDLPSYTNDSSTVFLAQGSQVMDKVSYTDDWHFQLLQTTKGVSLERFDPLGVSNDKNNWHSASETKGFATPGLENSQRSSANVEGALSLSSSSFSPDQDGYEDVLLMTYQLTEPEMVGNLVIYDNMGRKVKQLLNNELLGSSGTIKWDGINESGNKVLIGPYILIFEALNLETGEQVLLRKVVTVAGKL